MDIINAFSKHEAIMKNNDLKALVERLEAEKATIADDIKEVYDEAKRASHLEA